MLHIVHRHLAQRLHICRNAMRNMPCPCNCAKPAHGPTCVPGQAVWADLEDKPTLNQLQEFEQQEQLLQQRRWQQQQRLQLRQGQPQAVELQGSIEGGGAGRGGGRFLTPEPSHPGPYQPPSLGSVSGQVSWPSTHLL